MKTLKIVLAAALLLASAANAETRNCPGPGSADDRARRHGGDEIEFEVLRNGKPVGRHVTRFTREDGYLVVDSKMALSIRVLFIEAYKYRYSATERWCGGHLVRLDATVDANGKRSATSARATGETLEIEGPQGRTSAPLGVFSTNHWHAGVLETRAVINTLTGRVNEVRIARCSTPRPDGEGPPGAACYDYAGDLSARVWYDTEGRWVGLAFDGEDGSRFEYRCTSCTQRKDTLQAPGPRGPDARHQSTHDANA
jgi:hypothetical protein